MGLMPWEWWLRAPYLCGLSGLACQQLQLGQEVMPVQNLPQSHRDLQTFRFHPESLPTSHLLTTVTESKNQLFEKLSVSFVAWLVVASRFPFSFLTSHKVPSKSKFYAHTSECLGAPSREKATSASKISPSSKSLQKFERGIQVLFWNRKNLEFSFSYLRKKNTLSKCSFSIFFPCSWKSFYTNVKIN